jgi:UDP-galactopyranose mutase
VSFLISDKRYDYVIVGSGLFGATCAYELAKKHRVLVVEKRNHIGGNCFTENIEGVHVHKYGAHIFHTSDKRIWDWVNQFAEFRQFQNSPIANYKGELYSLPFNMWTFYQLWGVRNPEDAKLKIESQKYRGPITNLEEQARSMVGDDIFYKLIKGYTEKQWGKKCTELPPSIIKRLPVRFTWDNNYFNDKYQGIPIGGYTQIFDKLLDGVEVMLETDFFQHKEYFELISNKIIYTGPIDKFFNYQFGKLEYRSLRWENYLLDKESFQGHPVVNFTDEDTEYTRVLEHKFFDNQNQKKTYISKEYSCEYNGENEPYYPIRDEVNTNIYNKYKTLSQGNNKYIFGGRLGTYAYYDMHQVIGQAFATLEKLGWDGDSNENERQ